MSRGQDGKKRKRAARFALEPLEERLELSAGGAAAVERLGGQFQAQAAQINSLIIHRTSQLDTAYQTALSHSAPRSGGAAASTAQVDRQYNRFVRNVDRRVNWLYNHFNAAINRVAARLDVMAPAAYPALRSGFQGTVAAIAGALKTEARAARDAARGVVGTGLASIQQARTSGASAMSRAEAVDASLNRLSQSQAAADEATFDRLMGQYNSLSRELQPELAALQSGARRARGGVGHGYAGVGGSGLVGTGALRAGTTAAGTFRAGTTNGNGPNTGTGISTIGTGGTPGTGSLGAGVTGSTGTNATTGRIGSGALGTTAGGATGTGTTTGLGSTGALGSGAFVGPVSTTSTGTGTFTGPVATTGTGTGVATGGGTTTGALTTGTTTGAGTTIGNMGTVSTGTGTFVGPISTTGFGAGTGGFMGPISTTGTGTFGATAGVGGTVGTVTGTAPGSSTIGGIGTNPFTGPTGLGTAGLGTTGIGTTGSSTSAVGTTGTGITLGSGGFTIGTGIL